MRTELLGLPLEPALERLAQEGIVPQVVRTSAPRRGEDPRAVERVVYASDDGARLTVCGFLDPIASGQQETS